jgi:hypothetical protein
MRRAMQFFLVLALATVAPVTAAAQQRTWGKKTEQANARARTNVAKNQPVASHPEWRAVHHDHDRDADGRPPGWDHGRKVGWQGRSVPPGQVRTVDEHRHYHHRRHHRVWDREHHRWREHDHDRH